MPEKKTDKPTDEITSESPEILETEELDDAHGGALSRSSIGSPNVIKPVGTGAPLSPSAGGVNFNTVYGGTSGLSDLPLKR